MWTKIDANFGIWQNFKNCISHGRNVKNQSFMLAKSTKNRYTSTQKSIQNWTSIYSASWRPTWIPKPSQNASKIDAKSMKNGYQNRSKNCMLFEWPFSGSWRLTWCQKPPKTEPGGVFSSCFWAWKGLGRLLGALGLQDSPRANFWTQLDQIWSQLGPNMGHLGPKMGPCWGYVGPQWDSGPPTGCFCGVRLLAANLAACEDACRT